jgi:hypothetical protein
MKPRVEFDFAEIVRSTSGPESVVLVGRDQTGQKHDFNLVLPKGGGEPYVRALGFDGWFVREPGQLKRVRTERTFEGQVESYMTKDGVRTVITSQSPEYDQAAAEEIEKLRAGD